MSNGETIGVLVVDNVKTKRPLVETDRSLLLGVASVVGISLRSEKLLTIKDRQFRSILRGLAASIDARDPLTRGHSERVTEFAAGICEELGLPSDQREVISTAALLHDYGKLAVPDAILRKPGSLNPREREIVKIHAAQTEKILRRIAFEGIYRQVPAIAGAHHEKYDGSGYPRGLKGDEIPLGARIIAVADVYEAITAKRHYHEPMQQEDAVAFLRRHSGKSFEPRIVEAFLRRLEFAQPTPVEHKTPIAARPAADVTPFPADLTEFGVPVATPSGADITPGPADEYPVPIIVHPSPPETTMSSEFNAPSPTPTGVREAPGSN